jgi:SAM-dependent methyltransferase
MNFKLLFPTYRNRYLFIQKALIQHSAESQFGRVLNLGTGEGDYDPMIARFAQEMIGCDINPNDIAFARQLNANLENVTYQVEDALQLSFPDNHFDLIVSVDVMEHVGKPRRMLEEIQRVLKPGGKAFITFPQRYFPWTYDPINRVLSWFGDRHISQGAYAFGHWYLIDGADFRDWAADFNLEVLSEHNLSGHLVALTEMYWTGWVQQLFKDNARNVSGEKEKKVKLRPSTKPPGLVVFTDAFIRLDKALFGNGKHSVGKGFIIEKQ